MRGKTDKEANNVIYTYRNFTLIFLISIYFLFIENRLKILHSSESHHKLKIRKYKKKKT